MQTPQARMGYVGQHLTSVVTGIPGGRSGARGDDLFDPATGEVSEIKTCTRVDQLGRCKDCGVNVAAVELLCHNCGSKNIIRNDDSKWLITPQTEGDMATLFDPTTYYLVLFDFVDIASAAAINASIYAVDPKSWGFSMCMVDYWVNIRPMSKSKAPFNLWPFSLKFELMQPKLIYHAVISQDDSIRTRLFPGRDKPEETRLSPLTAFTRAKTLKSEVINSLCEHAGVRNVRSAGEALLKIDEWRRTSAIDDATLIKLLNYLIYWENISTYSKYLPAVVTIEAQNFQY